MRLNTGVEWRLWLHPRGCCTCICRQTADLSARTRPPGPVHMHHGCASCIWRSVLSSLRMARSSMACTWLRCAPVLRALRAPTNCCSVASSGGATWPTAATCARLRASEGKPKTTMRRRALSCSSQRSKVTSSACAAARGASSAAGSAPATSCVSAAHCRHVGSSSSAVTCRAGSGMGETGDSAQSNEHAAADQRSSSSQAPPCPACTTVQLQTRRCTCASAPAQSCAGLLPGAWMPAPLGCGAARGRHGAAPADWGPAQQGHEGWGWERTNPSRSAARQAWSGQQIHQPVLRVC